MKKLIALLSVITCIFGLTACSGEEQLNEYEQQKVTFAESYAMEQVVPFMQNFMDNANVGTFDYYTAEEVETLFEENYQMLVDGYAIKTGIVSFHSAAEEMGQILSIESAEATIDDSQIIVLVKVNGEVKDAEAEVILTNDMFMKIESIALNPVSSVGELMTKAALNTLIGMGTVFVVLIMICGIISAFGIIPKIQDKFKNNGKKEEKAPAAPVPAPAAAPVAAPAAAQTNVTNDAELIAVIAAAIAAYEGTTTDGFVVRSVRKVNRTRR